MCKAFAKRSFSVLHVGLKLKQHWGHGCAFILLPSSAVKQGHCRKKTCRCFLKSSQLDNIPLSCRDKKRGLWLANLIGRDTFHGFSAYLFCVSLLSGPALEYRPHPPNIDPHRNTRHRRITSRYHWSVCTSERNTSAVFLRLFVFQVFVIQLIQTT